MAVALAALDALIHLQGPDGERQVPAVDFHRLPEDRPELDTVIRPGELITAVTLPAMPFARHSHYLKVRDRASYAFALVSVAVAVDLDGGMLRDVRIALGGVAHKPWRAGNAESLLRGQAPTSELLARVGAEAVAGARPYAGNAFKVELAQRAVVRALRTVIGKAEAEKGTAA
jgi:xanthine dehydrogenase YagS FAD-binding subunit